MDWIIWAIILIFVVMGFAVWLGEHQKKSIAEKASKLYNFNATHKYGDFLVENKTLRWMVSYYTGTSRVFHISEVTGWELVENGQRYKSEGGLLRAVVGGALFGGTGAIIGASTAKRVSTVSNLAVNIYTNDMDTPLIVVHCLHLQPGQTIATNSMQYSQACNNAHQIMSVLQAMQFNYENNPDAYQIPKEVTNPTSNAKSNTKPKKEPMEIIVKYILLPILILCAIFLVGFGIVFLIVGG